MYTKELMEKYIDLGYTFKIYSTSNYLWYVEITKAIWLNGEFVVSDIYTSIESPEDRYFKDKDEALQRTLTLLEQKKYTEIERG
jgi:hypothetical protein